MSMQISGIGSMLDAKIAGAQSTASLTAAAQSAAAVKKAATEATAMQRLHKAAQQFEGVFVGMVMHVMRESVPDDSLFGSSNTEQMFGEMLDEQRSQAVAGSGELGIAKIIEKQLAPQVKSNAAHESQTPVLPSETL